MRKHPAVRIAATLAALFVAPNRLAAQPLTITHLAGTTGGNGWFDGTGSAARFSHPSGVTVDGSGNLYVSDSFNHTIRKVARTGDVSTLAGLAGSDGGADGTGSAARFNQPYGVAVDGSGNVYVADSFNSTIRKITPSGVVSTLAGLVGDSGSADGVGSAARFGRPFGIAMDGSGNLFVADRWNDTIRKVVVATGEVTTIAGLSGASGSADGIGSAARFYYPNGVVVDGSGNVYVAEDGNSTIRRIVVATGEVTTLAGSAGSTGSADGTGSAARFFYPEGVAADSSGNLFVADTSGQTIRQIVIATGEVTTLAGLAGGFNSGSADGVGSEARFYNPSGVASDAFGTLYVADTYNNTIRKVVVATGRVTTLAGLASSSGSADGTGSEARFDQPYGVAVDDSGNVYMADTYNCTIRKVTPASIVSTLAGLAGSCGSADGTGAAARFNGPRGVAADGFGNLFVADTFNSTIRKIVVATGEVTTLAGLAGFNTGTADGIGSAARFFFPGGIATDGSGNLYVADTDNNAIRMIVVSTRQVMTLAGLKGILNDGYADGIGNAARFEFPLGVAADRYGNVYVADSGNNAIRKIVVVTGEVSTLAGLAGVNGGGTTDGIGSEARFVGPSGVAVDG